MSPEREAARQKFEAWHLAEYPHIDLKRNSAGVYIWQIVQLRWEGWQAALAAPPQGTAPSPQKSDYCTGHCDKCGLLCLQPCGADITARPFQSIETKESDEAKTSAAMPTVQPLPNSARPQTAPIQDVYWREEETTRKEFIVQWARKQLMGQLTDNFIERLLSFWASLHRAAHSHTAGHVIEDRPDVCDARCPKCGAAYLHSCLSCKPQTAGQRAEPDHLDWKIACWHRNVDNAYFPSDPKDLELFLELKRLRAAEGGAQNGWVSAKIGSLPPLDEEVMVTSGRDGYVFLAILRDNQKWEMEADGSENPLTRFTHWHSLPAAPSSEGEPQKVTKLVQDHGPRIDTRPFPEMPEGEKGKGEGNG